MDRVHIQNGEIKKYYNSEIGRLHLSNGMTVSPIIIGWESEDGNDVILPVETNIIDHSVTDNVAESIEEIVELDKVIRNITVTDVPITEQMVNDERDKRIKAGTNIVIDGLGVVYVTGSKQDIANINTLGQIAIMRIINNDSKKIDFRDGLNIVHTLTPKQMTELSQEFSAYMSSVYESSWNLKSMSPIPLDYNTNDDYWPKRIGDAQETQSGNR